MERMREHQTRLLLQKKLETLNADELRVVIQHQQQLLAGPLSSTLPDKGERIRKKINELELRLKQIEDAPIGKSNEEPKKTPSQPTEPIPSPGDPDSSNPESTEDSEMDWLERKLKFLSMKENIAPPNRQLKEKQRQLTKGKRGVKMETKSKSHVVALDLKESITLGGKIVDDENDQPSWQRSDHEVDDEDEGTLDEEER
eukprot:TRINITY_DN12834_c0_g1_i1.p1 TRINITY_DN12834_c0_g1~~TRINITY_DN12834_c0_g1_i1.p1  ORF type:complete len:200 (-),score=41.56 TRINITY_DN12834_c0_g1_i1:13-612(-)